MRKISFYIIISTLSIFPFMQSCIDKEYDTDKLNRFVELNVPPVPLGNLDTIFVSFLPTLPPEIVIGANVVLTDTIRGIFNEQTISKFFYEGSGDVVFSTKVDAMVMPQESGLEMEVLIDVIDADRTKNEFVKIPRQRLISAKNQDFTIRIGAEYMKYMKNARDIHFIFAIRVRAINFTRNDYIYIRRFVLSTGGIQVQL